MSCQLTLRFSGGPRSGPAAATGCSAALETTRLRPRRSPQEPDRLEEPVRARQGVCRDGRIRSRPTVVGSAGRGKEMTEPFVDVKFTGIASGPHAIAESPHTAHWRHGIDVPLENERWWKSLAQMLVGRYVARARSVPQETLHVAVRCQ